MNETMGNTILRLRRESGLTQEQLGELLGVSYQAVSKWETGNSWPDISALPLLADLFSVSIDTLFGRETKEKALSEEGKPKPVELEAPALPWPDDDCFYAVLYHGHELIGSKKSERRFVTAQQNFCFQYEGPAQNIQCAFDLTVSGDVHGNVQAEGDMSCGAVLGGVSAGGDVSCGAVGGGVSAEGDVSCDDVAGGVTAGGDVTCDAVDGAVIAAGDVTCDKVFGNIQAGGDVSCDDVTGSVSAGGDLNCDRVDCGVSGSMDDMSSDELERELSGLGDTLSERLSGLGDAISDAVKKRTKNTGRIRRAWQIGDNDVKIDLDLHFDDEE